MTWGLVLGNPGRPQPVDSLKVKNPRTALILGVIPGLGQIYNGAYLKAGLYCGAFAYYFQLWRQRVTLYRENPNGTTFRRRNDAAWMAALVWAMSLLDAYVDAQLSDFKAYPLPEPVPLDSLEVKTNPVQKKGGRDGGKP